MRGAKEALRLAFRRGYRVRPDGSVIGPNGETVPTRRSYYAYLVFSIPGARSDIAVHRLAAYQLFGELAILAECVRHLNDIPTDNRHENIAIGTKRDNVLDVPRERRLRFMRAAGLKRRRLSPERVAQLRLALADGRPVSVVAEEFGLHPSSVSHIKHGRMYVDH